MKKIMFLLVPFMVLIFSFRSNAVSSADLTKVKNLVTTKYGYTISDNFATQVINYWESHNTTYPYMVITNQNGELRFSYSIDAPYQSGNNLQMRGIYTQKYQPAYTGQVAFDPFGIGNATFSYNYDNSYNFGTWSSFHTVPIDWDNPLYSVAIETPSFEVTYRNILYNEVDVPLNVNMTVDQQSELYCEVMAEYTLPNNLQYRYSSNSFEASQYTRISKTIVSAEQLVKARTLSALVLYALLKNKYAECLQELPLSSVSIRFPTDFEAQQILDSRQIYDELRQVCTVGGTAIKIYIRYFTIENQTQFVVGAWRIWNSTNPKTFGVELPSWYQPYIPASGDQGTNPTTETDPDVVVIPAGGQTPTGQYYDPSINITVGSNVPNYPDYPTIASYNLDNMLVDTMNNARSLSSFFGEFGGFIQSVFVFLPSWIWAIIGVGFSLSIVVMFLKIL